MVLVRMLRILIDSINQRKIGVDELEDEETVGEGTDVSFLVFVVF